MVILGMINFLNHETVLFRAPFLLRCSSSRDEVEKKRDEQRSGAAVTAAKEREEGESERTKSFVGELNKHTSDHPITFSPVFFDSTSCEEVS